MKDEGGRLLAKDITMAVKEPGRMVVRAKSIIMGARDEGGRSLARDIAMELKDEGGWSLAKDIITAVRMGVQVIGPFHCNGSGFDFKASLK